MNQCDDHLFLHPTRSEIALEIRVYLMTLLNQTLVCIGAFTEAVQRASALSPLFRARGAVPILGGPHARCYPQDAVQYYVQTNFGLGLDRDEGAEPFALTKRFVDLTSGAFPGYALLIAFGQAAPLNRAYQRANRVLPFPFLNNNQAMNVTPKPYTWPDFYERVIDLTRYSFPWRAILHRCRATPGVVPRWMKVVRAVSSEGVGRLKYHTAVLHRLNTDRQFRRYCEHETPELPPCYVDMVRQGPGAVVGVVAAGGAAARPQRLAHVRSGVRQACRSGTGTSAISNGPALPLGATRCQIVWRV